MDEKRDDQQPPAINRRKFIGALGAAAIAGGILESTGRQRANADQAQNYYFVDSWGNTVPVASDTIAAGIYPPLAPAPPSQQTQEDRGGRSQAEIFRRRYGPADDSCSGSMTVTSGYPKYNMLLVMVDQMRWPVWLPYGTSSWQSLFQTYLPNIYALQQYAYVFQNYYTAATKCSPARATLQTGLYSQQTGIFVTGTNPSPPPLQPYTGPNTGFPTIGNVLSQSFIKTSGATWGGYDTAWIGKWHLSAGPFQTSGPGIDGPSEYGYNDLYNIPTTSSKYTAAGSASGYYSPDGWANEGNAGNFLDGSVAAGVANVGVPDYVIGGVHDYQTFPPADTGLTAPGVVQLNDAAIAEAFAGYWLPNLSNLPSGQPWFAALSFVNPHDVNWFPYSYDYALTSPGSCPSSGDFGCASSPQQLGWQPPPVPPLVSSTTPTTYQDNTTGNPHNYSTTIPSLGASSPYLPYPANSLPSNWNYGDDPGTQPYGSPGTGPFGKPNLQQVYQGQVAAGTGSVVTSASDYPNGWLTFLNYYFWMQACVDYQIGQALFASPGVLKSFLGPDSGGGAAGTIIIFLADHGEYGGSHNLHAKGGALYDEVMHVPLFVSFPEARTNQHQPTARNFARSSVDILPFLYTMAIGNQGWRCAANTSDLVNYLRGRESIYDVIMAGDANTTPHRTAPNITTQGTCTTSKSADVQYVLHTMDEPITLDGSPPSSPPSHAIAFRTIDFTTCPNTGAKLGIYSYWDTTACNTCPSTSVGNQQFEFYNYYAYTGHPANTGETGNEGISYIDASGMTHLKTTGSPYSASAYLTSFNSIVYNELYVIYSQVQTAWENALLAYFNYLVALGESSRSCTATTVTACTSG